MNRTMTRVFKIDDDTCEVIFYYDEAFKKYFGDYPDFDETPKFTPEGKPWVTAMESGCGAGVSKSNHKETCFDCGSCLYFRRENPGDLIGICDCPEKRKKSK